MTDAESFKQFADQMSEMLRLSAADAARFAEILDDRMKEIADKQVSDALDREFNRGDYRY